MQEGKILKTICGGQLSVTPDIAHRSSDGEQSDDFGEQGGELGAERGQSVLPECPAAPQARKNSKT